MTSHLGNGLLAALGVYVVAILLVGAAARRARADESLSDFYLAGRSLGGFVLLLTLYATQYSGNTLLGYPGEAYRLGFSWVMCIGFMMAIVVAYLLFAPQLHRLSRRHAFVTPGDWLDHRFGSPALTVLASVLAVVALSNYLLAQLMAMGHVVSGLSGDALPYWAGVLLLTLVIIVYETLGGMRAVAWTDSVQGLMLLVGLVGILIVVVPSPAHLGDITAWMAEHAPEKAAVPSATQCATWVSTILLVGFSAGVYPHALQRIYAARSTRALKRSLSIMAFMPIVTMVPLLVVGFLAIQELGTLEGVAADQVMPMMLNAWAGRSAVLYALTLMVVLAVVAAIMSTADSVLLSLSSILAKDLLGRVALRDRPEAHLTRAGKVLSWAIVVVLVGVALEPRITLWGLIEIKAESLLQLSPVFILGVLWPGLTARAAVTGMIAGTAIALALGFGGYPRLGGVHAGVIGWGVNLALCVGLSSMGAAAGAPSVRLASEGAVRPSIE